MINGEIHFKPIDGKCITDDTFRSTKKDQENPKDFPEGQLEDCSPCEDTDQVTKGVYTGFPLLRESVNATEEKVQRNDYSCVTLVECQYLCYITETCLYFNFELKDSECIQPLGICWLKYGMGNFESHSLTKFRHKLDKGLFIIPPLMLF